MALEPACIGTRPRESKTHSGSTGNTPVRTGNMPATGGFPAPVQAPMRTPVLAPVRTPVLAPVRTPSHSSGLRVHFCNVI